jgi:hypothetical protein
MYENTKRRKKFCDFPFFFTRGKYRRLLPLGYAGYSGMASGLAAISSANLGSFLRSENSESL